uniref:Terminase large subunit GpA endonuclease domain-containing protein n=1 Tax=Candidatus Kentrum sp. FW TaxID=2126338 RepID=A0A450TL14_9GAMM|nr:MAG: hypothetical protein BECKFW1821B_GA0114236_114310 [Candidatus Kentron sp. FW]
MGGIDPLAATGREWRKPLLYPLLIQRCSECTRFLAALEMTRTSREIFGSGLTGLGVTEFWKADSLPLHSAKRYPFIIMDWLDGQMKLEARGIGRWHYYREVRADYFEQITSEVKAPHKSIKYRGASAKEWAPERGAGWGGLRSACGPGDSDAADAPGPVGEVGEGGDADVALSGGGVLP